MATTIIFGFSSEKDPALAFREAAIMAKKQLTQFTTNLVIVCTTPDYAATPPGEPSGGLEALRNILNPEKLIGITAPALIMPDGIKMSGVAILVISSDEIDFTVAARDSLDLLPPHEIGINFARDITSNMHSNERLGSIIFCSTVTLNHSLLVRGIQERLGRAFGIAGAINPGAIYTDDKIIKNALGGIIISGQAVFASSVRHGWQPLGKPRVITDSIGNQIRRIDNKPAISIYQDYFPEEFTRNIAENPDKIGLLYPLGLSTGRPREYLIKTPSIILPDGSIICQGEVPPGTKIHLMLGDKDACRKAAHDAAIDVRDKLRGKCPKLILIFASIARKKLFGRSAWQEIHQIKEILGLACPVFGMYTYGEIGSPSAAGQSGLLDVQTHNASILITAIG
jgi:hypothetical protein